MSRLSRALAHFIIVHANRRSRVLGHFITAPAHPLHIYAFSATNDNVFRTSPFFALHLSVLTTIRRCLLKRLGLIRPATGTWSTTLITLAERLWIATGRFDKVRRHWLQCSGVCALQLGVYGNNQRSLLQYLCFYTATVRFDNNLSTSITACGSYVPHLSVCGNNRKNLLHYLRVYALQLGVLRTIDDIYHSGFYQLCGGATFMLARSKF